MFSIRRNRGLALLTPSVHVWPNLTYIRQSLFILLTSLVEMGEWRIFTKFYQIYSFQLKVSLQLIAFVVTKDVFVMAVLQEEISKSCFSPIRNILHMVVSERSI